MPHQPHVEIFIPCFIDQVQPEIGFSVVKILEALGCQVHYQAEQTCCGQPAFNAGYAKQACNVAEKWIRDYQHLAQKEDAFIVVPSASCVGMIRNNYEKLITDNSLKETFYALQQKTFEFTEFIVDVLEVEQIPHVKFPYKITYHDSCSALRECGIGEAPRTLLQNIEGLQWIDLPSGQTCCGFGGTFSIKFQGISVAMAEQKLDNVTKTQAEYLVSADYSCLMHLEAFSNKSGKLLRFIHIADVLASGW